VNASAAATRTRALEDFPVFAAQAAELLAAPNNTIPFPMEDALRLVPYLRLVEAATGAKLLVEGDRTHTGHLLLILEGSVSVDIADGDEAVELAVLGAGQILGELALLDGQPRSASCTAVSTVRAAGLSRVGLQRLVAEQPGVAAKFLATLAQRTGERLRGLGDQLKMYSQLVQNQQHTIARLQER
jgi:CRP-like cAMP-binding protein